MPTPRGWIGVDLDGTLAFYDGWMGHTHVGKPIPKMVERVKKWIEEGITVRVFTARVSGGTFDERNEVRKAISEWTALHIGRSLEATATKDYEMCMLYDDRAVHVEHNTGEIAGEE